MLLPPKVRDLTGQTFCELTVVNFIALGKYGAHWRCLCTCGTFVEVRAGDLKSGNTTSCGCRKRKILSEKAMKHGEAAGKHHTQYSRAYKIWRGMIQRCYSSSCKAFPNYGGRGILVCDKWRNNYQAFVSDMGNPPEGGTLERIDVHAGYSKDNCKWIPLVEQARNRQNTVRVVLNGEEMIQADAARKLNINPATLFAWRKGRRPKPGHIDLTFITQP